VKANRNDGKIQTGFTGFLRIGRRGLIFLIILRNPVNPV
jgi:hypothetical protein